MFGLLFVVAVVFSFKAGACILAMYAVVTFSIWRTRIIVRENSIALTSALGAETEVKFSDISGSVAEYVLEPDHPVALHVFGRDADNPAITIKTKAYRREDVAWLLSLPELRVVIDA